MDHFSLVFLALLSNTWAYQNFTHLLTKKYSGLGVVCLGMYVVMHLIFNYCDELPKSKSNGHTKGRSLPIYFSHFTSVRGK